MNDVHKWWRQGSKAGATRSVHSCAVLQQAPLFARLSADESVTDSCIKNRKCLHEATLNSLWETPAAALSVSVLLYCCPSLAPSPVLAFLTLCPFS
ncbi:unnamed protein product, partial [Rangifer tarandus platyrhynchus]